MVSRLYWIGLFEERPVKKWEWFFRADLTPAISYCTMRAVGGGQYSHIYGNRVALVLI